MDQYLIHKYANLITPVERNLDRLQNFISEYGGGKNILRDFGIFENTFSLTFHNQRYYICFSKEEKRFLISDVFFTHNNIYNDNDHLFFERGEALKLLPRIDYEEENIITPEDCFFSEICNKIDSHIVQIQKILDEYVVGNLPHKYLYMCYKKAKKLDCISFKVRKWDSFIGLDTNVQKGLDLDIDDFIDLTGLLLPTLQGGEVKLEHTKKCKNCGTYYQAKGEKAVFCSEACRSSYRRKMKKEKARPPTS